MWLATELYVDDDDVHMNTAADLEETRFYA